MTDWDFVEAMDLDRPELGDVKRAATARCLGAAKAAVVEHFRTRAAPLDGLPTSSTTSRLPAAISVGPIAPAPTLA